MNIKLLCRAILPWFTNLKTNIMIQVFCFKSYNNDQLINTTLKTCKNPERTNLHKELMNQLDRGIIDKFEYSLDQH
jgi:hypothetical protein